MLAKELLLEAASLVSDNRARQHGDALGCHGKVAQLWSAYLDRQINPADVALLLVLMKVARSRHGELNPDDYRDAAGYAALAGEISFRDHETNP